MFKFLKNCLIIFLILSVSVFFADRLGAMGEGGFFEQIIKVVATVAAVAVVVVVAVAVAPVVSTVASTVGNIVGGVVNVVSKIKGFVDGVTSGDPFAMAKSFGFSPDSLLGSMYQNTIGNVLPVPNINLPTVDLPNGVTDAKNFYDSTKKTYDDIQGTSTAMQNTLQQKQDEIQKQAQAQTHQVKDAVNQAVDSALPKPNVRLSGPSLPSAPQLPTINTNINIDFSKIWDRGFWAMKTVPVLGEYVLHGEDKQLIQLYPGNFVTLGLIIKDNNGNYITKKEELKGYLPVYTRIPLPAGSPPVGIIYRRKQTLPDENLPIHQGYAYKMYGKEKILGVPDGKLADVILGSSVTLIPFSLSQEVLEVEMNIYDPLWNHVAKLIQSAPSPANPIPFVWHGKFIGKGWAQDQLDVSKGQYNVVLKANLKDGTSVESEPLAVNVFDKSSDTTQAGDNANIAANEIPNNGEGNFYGFIAVQNPENNTSGGLEKLYIWLHSNEQGRPLSVTNYISYSTVDTEKSYTQVTYLDEDDEKMKTVRQGFKLTMGKTAAGFQKIEVVLMDINGKSMTGANVRLVSSRNQGSEKLVDIIFPAIAKTNQQGIAVFSIWTDEMTLSDDPDEQQANPNKEKEFSLYAEVDGLWLKEPVRGNALVEMDIRGGVNTEGQSEQ